MKGVENSDRLVVSGCRNVERCFSQVVSFEYDRDGIWLKD